MIRPCKSDFYETVTEVNSDLPFFFVGRVFVLCFGLQRMLFSTVFLFALYVSHFGSVPVGVQLGEVDAASYRTAFKGQTRHAVIGTRVGRNKEASWL